MSWARAIRREIEAADDFLTGTVLTQKQSFDFGLGEGGGGVPMWVVDVDVGGTEQKLENVPIKMNGAGTRFYADVGQTVMLRRNARGRYDIIGPADKVNAAAEVIEYDFEVAGAGGTPFDEGLTLAKEAYSYLRGTLTFDDDPAGTGLYGNNPDGPFGKWKVTNGAGDEV